MTSHAEVADLLIFAVKGTTLKDAMEFGGHKDVQTYIKHYCFDDSNYRNLYNENTVKKDINVLIHNYHTKNSGNVEDSNTILSPLNLINELEDGTYSFNYDSKNNVPEDIFLYALLLLFKNSRSISFESMKDLSLIFCLTNNSI